MKLALVLTLIGQLQTTAYRSVPSQTDDSPFTTSIGERVHPHGIAVSQDLLKKNGGPLDYGDLIYVENLGFKIVNDCMANRHRRRADVWVPNYASEKAFDEKFKGRRLKVFLVKEKQK